jgi:hypothetical protein
VRIRLFVAAALIAGSFLARAAQSRADGLGLPGLSGPAAVPEPSAVDFEAPVAFFPPGAERTDGLGDAVRQAVTLGEQARAQSPVPPEAPAFVKAIAAAAKARMEAIGMLSSDATAAAGERAMREAAADLDKRSTAALAEHAPGQ